MNRIHYRMMLLLLAAGIAVAFAGCGGTGPAATGSASNTTTQGPLASGGASSIFVVSGNTNGNGNNTILRFTATANGTVTPTATLTPQSDLLIEAMITDSSGKIYLAGATGNGSGTGVIFVYPAGATGNASPIQAIYRPTNIYADIFGAMAVDTAGNLYVYDSNYNFTTGSNTFNIDVFAPGATGSSTPIRQITGSSTQLTSVAALAVDASGNLFVNAQVQNGSSLIGTILEFPPNANGNVAPTRVLTNPIAGSQGLINLALDSSGNIYTSVYSASTSGSSLSSLTGEVLKFASGASGAATPITIISGTATGLGAIGGLVRDAAGNIYITNLEVSVSSSLQFSILAFGPKASGNATPALNATSTQWPDGDGQIALY